MIFQWPSEMKKNFLVILPLNLNHFVPQNLIDVSWRHLVYQKKKPKNQTLFLWQQTHFIISAWVLMIPFLKFFQIQNFEEGYKVRVSLWFFFFKYHDSLRSFFGSANFCLCLCCFYRTCSIFLLSSGIQIMHMLNICNLLCLSFSLSWILYFCPFLLYSERGCQVCSSHLELISTVPWWQQADLLRLISSLILTTSRVVYNSAPTWKW